LFAKYPLYKLRQAPIVVRVSPKFLKPSSQLISICFASDTIAHLLRLSRNSLRGPQTALLHHAWLDQRLHLRTFAFCTQAIVIRCRRAANCAKYRFVKAFSLERANLSTYVAGDEGHLTAQAGICIAMDSQACRAIIGTAKIRGMTRRVCIFMVICQAVIDMLRFRMTL
jgi:hypothetical protein